MTRGRPSKFNSDIDQAAKNYLVDFNKVHNHPFPSVVGMAIAINIAKSTLYKWAEEGKGSISDTLRHCAEYQEMLVLHGGITNEFNSTISKLVLANFGYHDKQDNTQAGPDGGPIEIDQEWRVTVVE
jgi:hypothetical protein